MLGSLVDLKAACLTPYFLGNHNLFIIITIFIFHITSGARHAAVSDLSYYSITVNVYHAGTAVRHADGHSQYCHNCRG